MKMQKLMGALILILMLGATPVTAQNMSDSQVLEYVKEGIRQGKEQKQLASLVTPLRANSEANCFCSFPCLIPSLTYSNT